MLTERDNQIINLIDKFKLISSKQVYELVFNNVSDRYCRHRLKTLTDNKVLKRVRNHIDQDYIYYINRQPKQIEHRILLVNLYLQLSKIYTIVTFKVEYICKSLRADAYMEIEKNNLIYGFFIEICRTGEFNQDKYENYYSSGMWREDGFNSFPRVLIVHPSEIHLTKTKIRYYLVNPCTSENLSKII